MLFSVFNIGSTYLLCNCAASYCGIVWYLHLSTLALCGTCTYLLCRRQLWKGFLMWAECWGSRCCLIFHPGILSHLRLLILIIFICYFWNIYVYQAKLSLPPFYIYSPVSIQASRLYIYSSPKITIIIIIITPPHHLPGKPPAAVMAES